MNIKSTISKEAYIVCQKPPTPNYQPLTGLSDLYPVFEPFYTRAVL